MDRSGAAEAPPSSSQAMDMDSTATTIPDTPQPMADMVPETPIHLLKQQNMDPERDGERARARFFSGEDVASQNSSQTPVADRTALARNSEDTGDESSESELEVSFKDGQTPTRPKLDVDASGNLNLKRKRAETVTTKPASQTPESVPKRRREAMKTRQAPLTSSSPGAGPSRSGSANSGAKGGRSGDEHRQGRLHRTNVRPSATPQEDQDEFDVEEVRYS